MPIGKSVGLGTTLPKIYDTHNEDKGESKGNALYTIINYIIYIPGPTSISMEYKESSSLR